MCLFNVILCLMLEFLSIFFYALQTKMLSFLYVANNILVVSLSTILMGFYGREELHPFSNFVIYNPCFPLMWDNLYCTIVSRRFILLIVCFCPSVSRGDFSNFNSSSISQFDFLMQWHFLFFFCDTAVIFAFYFNFNGYFPCSRKVKSYHPGL
jgi:hypothetical protein